MLCLLSGSNNDLGVVGPDLLKSTFGGVGRGRSGEGEVHVNSSQAGSLVGEGEEYNVGAL